MLRLSNIGILICLYPLVSVVSTIQASVSLVPVQFSSLRLSGMSVQFSSVHYDCRRWQSSSVQFIAIAGDGGPVRFSSLAVVDASL